MRKRKKNKIYIIILIPLLIFGVYYIYKKAPIPDLTPKDNKEEIKSHYNTYVKTNKETSLYNQNGEEVGKINTNIELTLKELSDEESIYFPIQDLEGYYIKYTDVTKIDTPSEPDTRYQNYIPFNQNIITTATPTLYDEEGNYLYQINESLSLPIIINDSENYGIIYSNKLSYIKKEDIQETIENHNTDKKNSTGIAVLNYHAFYDETIKEEKEDCTSEICHSKTQFKSHLDLIKEKGMLTLKMDEVEKYIDGKLQLPKSVLITIDDGAKTKVAVDLLTEYKMYATIFLITSWFDTKDYYKTDYIELHSHSHNMHDVGVCKTGQGGGIQCLPEEEIQKDLSETRKALGGSHVFCYPFYEYNEYSIKMLKQAGFTMAFVGESSKSDNLVHVGSDKFRLKRFVIVTYTTLKDLNNYFDQIK